MNLRKRIERLEKQMVTPEGFEEVWDRMRARMRLKIRMWETSDGEVEKPLSPEDEALLAGDSDELRRADQAVWDRYAKANKVTDLEANDGALYVPIAIRVGQWEAEDAEREERQGAGIKKAMASLDRGLGVTHERVEAWVTSFRATAEPPATADE